MRPPPGRDKGGVGIRAVAAVTIASAGRLAALALPPRCPGCGVPVAEDHRFCPDCWSGLRFLAPPWCAACHLPFAFDRGGDARCAACLAEPPRHAGIRAAVAYGPVARSVALRLKHGGRLGMAGTMAAAMRRLVPPNAELLVPVPLHRLRLWRRGYNQAALVAEALGRATGVPVARTALLRTRWTPLLRDLGAAGRARAVRGAFRLADADAVVGRRVVLVDDVYTSGATTDACARTLLAGGAASVTVLCWARVLSAGDAD